MNTVNSVSYEHFSVEDLVAINKAFPRETMQFIYAMLTHTTDLNTDDIGKRMLQCIAETAAMRAQDRAIHAVCVERERRERSRA